MSSAVTAVAPETDQSAVPEDFALHPNYPNPFNPGTRIRFDLPVGGAVSLDVFNTLGQKVETLVEQVLPAGSHTVLFDGRHLASDLYFYRLTQGQRQQTRPMLLLK